MRPLRYSINVTLDGCCDHRAMFADEDLRLIRHARYFVLQLAERDLTGSLFRQILGRIERLAWHPT